MKPVSLRDWLKPSCLCCPNIHAILGANDSVTIILQNQGWSLIARLVYAAGPATAAPRVEKPKVTIRLHCDSDRHAIGSRGPYGLVALTATRHVVKYEIAVALEHEAVFLQSVTIKKGR